MDETLSKKGAKIVEGVLEMKHGRVMDWRALVRMVKYCYGLRDEWFGCKGGTLKLRFACSTIIDGG